MARSVAMEEVGEPMGGRSALVGGARPIRGRLVVAWVARAEGRTGFARSPRRDEVGPEKQGGRGGPSRSQGRREEGRSQAEVDCPFLWRLH